MILDVGLETRAPNNAFLCGSTMNRQRVTDTSRHCRDMTSDV